MHTMKRCLFAFMYLLSDERKTVTDPGIRRHLTTDVANVVDFLCDGQKRRGRFWRLHFDYVV